jgi:hypothetical protein
MLVNRGDATAPDELIDVAPLEAKDAAEFQEGKGSGVNEAVDGGERDAQQLRDLARCEKPFLRRGLFVVTHTSGSDC